MMQSLRIIAQRPIARAPTAPYLRATTRFSSTDAEAEKTTLAKADLVAIVAKEYDISVAQSTRILDTVLDTIVEAVSKKHTVKIASFGKFEPVTSAARFYPNPKTKIPVWKEETTRVKFRPALNFKECVSKGGKESKE